jgi:hypothetical protein
MKMKSLLPIALLVLANGYGSLYGAKPKKDSAKETKEIPNVSLHNKSGKKIWVALANGGFQRLTSLIASDTYRVNNNGNFEKTIDLSKETVLTIYSDKNNEPDKEIYQATFPTNQTLYIKWKDNKLVSQLGVLKGHKKSLNKTQEGYPLANNVDTPEIKGLGKWKK